MEFKDEVRCGFLVTTFRKKVWEKQLEMLKDFIQICQKYHLKYCAASGTLLGAVRHHGYIPWDDDIDIYMPRADYDAFIKIAGKELKSNFTLQCYLTEKLYPNGHIQIRNNDTTCLIYDSLTDLNLGKNCGIFIDIFPLDDMIEDPKKRKKYCRKINLLKKLAFNYVYKNKHILKRVLVKAYFCFHSITKTIEKIDLQAKKYEGQTHLYALTTYAPGYERNMWQKDLFDSMVECPFEDITIMIPEQYDAVLKIEYGDYMKIPENKEGGSEHGKCYFDFEKPYTAYQHITEAEFHKLIEEQKM